MYNAELDKKYLAREVLPDVVYLITDDVVRITTASTQFVYMTKLKPLYTKSEMLDKYKELLDFVRVHKDKFKIKYTLHVKKIIENNYEGYKQLHAQGDKLFKEMLQKAYQVQRRGIHYGCDDDYMLKEIYACKSVFNSIHFRDSAYSKVMETIHYLEKTYKELQYEVHNTQLIEMTVLL